PRLDREVVYALAHTDIAFTDAQKANGPFWGKLRAGLACECVHRECDAAIGPIVEVGGIKDVHRESMNPVPHPIARRRLQRSRRIGVQSHRPPTTATEAAVTASCDVI